MKQDAAEELSALRDAALEAAERTRRDFGTVRTGAVQFKSEKDLVTETDYAVEALLRERLCHAFPQAHFIGEESDGGEALATSLPEALVVDPLDGTANFVHGIPYYSISIALLREGRTVAAVVAAPELGATYTATLGGGAFRNGQAIAVSERSSLGSAIGSTGFAAIRSGLKPDNVPLLSRAVYELRDIRRFGSAAIDLCYVAEGKIELFWEFALNDWDIAAGALILREAGGRVSTIEGADAYLGGDSLLGSNGLVHDEFLRLARDVLAQTP